MAYQKLTETYYINKVVNIKQLKSHVRCHFCQIAYQCYYHNSLCYRGFVDSYRYYICDLSHQDLLTFPGKMMLLNYLKHDLCFDIITVIYSYFKDITAPCIISLRNEKINRHAYLNCNYDKLTIRKLQELMVSKNIFVAKNKRKEYYIDQIKNDIMNKKYIWLNDEIGL
jgi:hypothetical protein